MANPAGESTDEILRLDFDRKLMLQFRGAAVTSGAGDCGIETDQKKGSDHGRRNNGKRHPLNRGCKKTEFMMRSRRDEGSYESSYESSYM